MTGKPKFDATINLGHVLTIAAMLCAGAAGYTSIQVSIVELRKDIGHFSDKLVDHESRIRTLEARLSALEMR